MALLVKGLFCFITKQGVLYDFSIAFKILEKFCPLNIFHPPLVLHKMSKFIGNLDRRVIFRDQFLERKGERVRRNPRSLKLLEFIVKRSKVRSRLFRLEKSFYLKSYFFHLRFNRNS